MPNNSFPAEEDDDSLLFVDDHEARHGFSFHRRLIAVAPSPPWAFTGDHFGSSVERPKMDTSRKSPSKSTSPSLDDGGGGDRKEGGDGGDIGGCNAVRGYCHNRSLPILHCRRSQISTQVTGNSPHSIARRYFAKEIVAFVVSGDHAIRAPYDVVRRSRRRDFAQLNISD